MNFRTKEIGLGTISPILLVLGLTFNTLLKSAIINFFQLKSIYSFANKINYTIIYSILFFIASVLVGSKYKDDFGAQMSIILSKYMLGFTITALLLYKIVGSRLVLPPM
ncbi:hypothetical protein [Clostridium grantii]|nr:hypothetical protein [Clostridium grantii]